jgi:hypothetical protein
MRYISTSLRSGIQAGAGALLVLGAAPVLAGDVQVTYARCAAEIHVIARDAPLSAVLNKLATVLDFQLRFDSDNDPRVTLDTTERAEALPARLGPSESVTVMFEHDPNCAGRQRIVKVWVLPSGSGSAAQPSAVAMQQSEEQARLAKAGAETVLRAHGMNTEGDPLRR